MGKPEIRLKYLKEQDKPYRNETNEKINYTSDYVEWLEKRLSLCDVSGMFSKEQMEQAWTDGAGCGETRSGFFDIENYL